AALGALIAAGCQTAPQFDAIPLEEYGEGAPASPAFMATLANAYDALASGDEVEGGLAPFEFRRRADVIRSGVVLLPISLLNRQIDDPARETFIEERSRLIFAIDRSARTRIADRTAMAQSHFDCWLVAHERKRSEAAADCEAAFRDEIASIEAILSGGALTIVILPEDDGSIGGVEVAQGGDSLLLDAAFQAGQIVGENGGIAEETFAPAEVDELFGGVLATLPDPPRRYTIYFVSGTDEPTTASRAVMDEARAYALSQDAYEIEVVGHTDSVGAADRNVFLSRARASRVKDFLVDAGVDAGQIEATGRGEIDPLVRRPNNTAEPQNRRVEVVV
ncbi:MAG: OmpA family protein, partial [Pseudomonadota bacterium]